jgi:hypothetical protein
VGSDMCIRESAAAVRVLWFIGQAAAVWPRNCRGKIE